MFLLSGFLDRDAPRAGEAVKCIARAMMREVIGATLFSGVAYCAVMVKRQRSEASAASKGNHMLRRKNIKVALCG